ncbi:MAG: hypothetical protein HY332_00245 [Chloroflexi bacterium]|nr:hypothetical protein [Chloroflexota bacterium]
MTVDLIKSGNSFVRLLAVDEADINKLLNENLKPMWDGEDAPAIASKRAADAVNEFLKSNPQ